MNRRTFLRNAALAVAAAPAVPAAIARVTAPVAGDMMVTHWFCTAPEHYCSPEYLAVMEKLLADVDKQMGIPKWFFNERQP